MNYRLSTLLALTSYAADKTEIIDIDVIDPISQIIIELTANITNDTAITAHVMKCITKIELVDGSDVLFSLTGKEAEAADWYCNHNFNSPWNIYMGWGSTTRYVRLNFGRFLLDPLLAFDPSKFRNPQLKITLDINAGGAVPTSNTLRVWAVLFDEKIVSPVGFLMHKEIKDYTIGTSAHEYTDMPKDYPYRKLFIRQQEEGTEGNINIANVKLSENQDKRIIFDHDPETILRTIAMISPPIWEYIHARIATAATYIYCTPTARVYAIATELGDTSGSGAIATGMGDGGKIAAICATAQKYAQLFVNGFLPHGVWEIPFGLQDMIEDWYDVSRVGSLKLDITGGSGAAGTETAQIFLQQLRKY